MKSNNEDIININLGLNTPEMASSLTCVWSLNGFHEQFYFNKLTNNLHWTYVVPVFLSYYPPSFSHGIHHCDKFIVINFTVVVSVNAVQ